MAGLKLALVSIVSAAAVLGVHATLPVHSWDTVPIFYHSCNESGVYNDTSLEIITRFPIVTVEKGQGLNVAPDGLHAEDKILAALQSVKTYAASKGRQVSTVAYFNSVLDWEMYDLHTQMLAHPSYWLHDTTGKVVRIPGDHSFPQPKSGMLVFDFGQQVVRDLWADACLALTKTGHVDGCFSDRSTSSSASWGSAYAAGHLKVHQELQQQLGLDKGPLIANGGETMPGVNGAMIENFRADNASLQLLFEAVAQGKIVEAHAGYGQDGTDNHCEGVTNSLSAFLIGAGERSYYGCSRGWKIAEDPMDTVWHAEYDYKLGAPLGPATLSGTVYTRKFASGTVATFDSKSGEGNIQWASKEKTRFF